MSDPSTTTLLSTFPLSITRVSGNTVRAYRVFFFRIIQFQFTAQESNGMHITLSGGIWRCELAITFDFWDTVIG